MQRDGVGYALVPTDGGGGVLQPLSADGLPAGPADAVPDLAAAVRAREQAHRPRWVWPDTAEVYPALLAAGVRVDRCYDVALTEALLLGYAGQWGQPRSLAAAEARRRGEPVPDDPSPRGPDQQPTLFDPGPPDGAPPADRLAAVVAVHADQLARLGRTAHPDRCRLLAAAESAGALAAAEMTAIGLPWRADVHDALLRELLGPRPPPGLPPPRLQDLADRIAAAFAGRRVNPDSPAEVVRAFAREGLAIPSARSSVLRAVDHPAVPLLLEYKELSRLHAAHGWAWLETWVRGGRFRPEYVPGGVVSGRWATRGGGALQIPHAVRRAVVAEPGRVLVVADAAQLEPRVLAALSGDRGMAAASARGDLYAAVAADAFGGDRARAKVAVLSAMYGATAGEATPLLAVLRRQFPAAVEHVEAAARAGEEGRLVRSRLGRTCPPPSAGWREQVEIGSQPDAVPAERRRADQLARDRGRFTRNFVVQASAADWALVFLAALRRRLAAPAPAGAGSVPGPGPGPGPGLGSGPGGPAELVFFQHDEVVVHCPEAAAGAVIAAVDAAADEARRLVFAATEVRFPLETAIGGSYAEAK